MPTIYNCDPSELVEKTSEELKKVESIKAPEWAPFVKTSVHKERPPVKDDWWYSRASSILKEVYRHGPIGVSKLRRKYGGKKNRGVKPEHFFKGSGNIIRKIMQQLEKEGLVKKELKSVHKGRVITAKGKKFLDDIAAKISKIDIPKKEVKREKPGKEIKVETKKLSNANEKGLEKLKTIQKETKQENKVEQKQTKTEKKEVPKK